MHVPTEKSTFDNACSKTPVVSVNITANGIVVIY